MSVSIAIPEPTSNDQAYNQRSMLPYLSALRAAGATPIIVPLEERQDCVARMLDGAHGILLPGSRYDVDPQRYGESPAPESSEPDPGRAAVDELMLQDAFSLHKPVLGICHGAQTLSVWCNGALVQDLKTVVNHRPGSDVVEAHALRIEPGSRLASLLPPGELNEVLVNSSHHQAIRVPGGNLVVSAVSPRDGVIEAVEFDSTEHFVLGVQWHPERTYIVSAFSRGIFAAFVKAAANWQPQGMKEQVARV
jgi:putative glutamine amidotransferase